MGGLAKVENGVGLTLNRDDFLSSTCHVSMLESFRVTIMRLLSIIVVWIFISTLQSRSAVAATPLLDLSEELTIGDSEQGTLAKLKKAGIRYERIATNMSMGYSKALTAGPGLLAMLNTHQVKHDLLNPLAKPSFVMLYQYSRMGVLAFTNGQMHSFILALADADVKPTKNPFSFSRLKGFHQQRRFMKSLCRTMIPVKKVRQAQVFVWKGSDCTTGGNILISHTPGQRYPLTLLAHP